jgi:hypothetical protein
VISVLCDNALVNGFAANERPVGSKLVQDVCRDFHIQCRDDIPDDSPVAMPAVNSVAAPPASTIAAPVAPAPTLHAVTPSQAPLVPAPEPAKAAPPTDPLFASIGRRRRFGIF